MDGLNHFSQLDHDWEIQDHIFEMFFWILGHSVLFLQVGRGRWKGEEYLEKCYLPKPIYILIFTLEESYETNSCIRAWGCKSQDKNTCAGSFKLTRIIWAASLRQVLIWLPLMLNAINCASQQSDTLPQDTAKPTPLAHFIWVLLIF